jgi:hypothetical protein
LNHEGAKDTKRDKEIEEKSYPRRILAGTAVLEDRSGR